MQEVEAITSKSSDGLSEISVDIKFDFSPSKSDLQIIWTKLRNKLSDATSALPQEARTPIVNDDFGDVYGLLYYISGDGYSYRDLKQYATELQKDLLQVKGVGKVKLDGVQNEAIYIEVSKENAAVLGVSISKIYDILAQQNAVTPAGSISVDGKRIIVDPTGAIDSIDSIRNSVITIAGDGKLIYLKDIAKVTRGYKSPAKKIFRYNGKPAIALGVSGVLGGNIVKISDAVEEKIQEAKSRRPVGMELSEFYHQGKVVTKAVDDFIINVVAALVIVVVTLFLFMGFKSASIIGGILLLTIAATLMTMQMMAIPMHRISLGALIIALGMMVDNAIVVVEGILTGIKNGQKKLEIAKAVVKQTQWPLLGGTLVGIIAFAPIGLAPGSTAEYTGHLFWVVLISLLYSWVFAITIAPLGCYLWFKELSEEQLLNQTKTSGFTVGYKKFIVKTLQFRWPILVATLGLFAFSIWGFSLVNSGFFPKSSTPQLVIDYRLPQGTDIKQTAADMRQIEGFLQTLKPVEAVKTLVGGGTMRYLLTYSAESASSSYGQILLKYDDYKNIDATMPIIQAYIRENFPAAQAKTWRFKLGPGGGAAIEAEFKGADPKILRSLANQAKNIMALGGKAVSIKDDWGEPVSVIVPIYSENKARRAGVSRKDLAESIFNAYSGKTIGAYRESGELIPIISRQPGAEENGLQSIKSINVISSVTGKSVPIAQLVDGYKTIWRDGLIITVDRVYTIKAQSDPINSVSADELLQSIKADIEAIKLPDGYSFEWRGEAGSSSESNDSLASTIPMGAAAMVLVVVILFGAIKQPLVIWLVVPLAAIGVVWGLVFTGVPLEFMGILGVLSLSGLLIKNAIVLVDQMDFEIKSGKKRFDAVVDSATSRVRPVMMGTLTTVLGVVPLYFDVFFQSMAVVIIFGLTFATLLTLILIPILYKMFLDINENEVPV